MSLLIDQLKFENDLPILETTIWMIASLSADLAHREIIRTYLTDQHVIKLLKSKDKKKGEKTVDGTLFILNNLMNGAPLEIFKEQQAEIISLTIACFGNDDLQVAESAIFFLNNFLLIKKDVLEKSSFSAQSAISSVMACFKKPTHLSLFPAATELLSTLISLEIDQLLFS